MGGPSQSAEHAAIGRRAAVFGGWTLLSRIAGLFRDVVIARVLGAGLQADAFYVAFRIPNLLRRLLAEGAMTMAFVPIYTEYKHQSRAAAAQTANVIFTLLAVGVAGLVVCGIVLTPWLVRLVAPGFVADPAKFELTVTLARIMFPYLWCVCLMALAMGILQTERHFSAPAMAPIFLNLIMIAAALWLAPRFMEPTVGLAIGVVVAGLAQFGVQLPPLWRRGLIPRLSFAWRHPSVRQLVTIMIPSLYGGAVYQVNVVVVTLLASLLPEGSVTYLWYADRITEFPLGILAVALATVTLPTLSDHSQSRDYAAFRSTVNLSLRMAIVEAIPAATGIILLAVPIVRLLFEGGRFTPEDSARTAAALVGFACGIPSISVVRNLVPAFYALKRPRAPVVAATVGLLVNFLVAVLLMNLFLHVGLAFAMAISGAAQMLLLFLWLRRLVGPLGGWQLARTVALAFMADVVMVISVSLCAQVFGMGDTEMQLTQPIHMTHVVSCILVGIGVYVACLRLVLPAEFHHLTAILQRRRPSVPRDT